MKGNKQNHHLESEMEKLITIEKKNERRKENEKKEKEKKNPGSGIPHIYTPQ